MSENTEKLVDESGRNSLDPKHAPVALPAGSFDLEKLASNLDSAIGEDNRNAAVAKAIEDSAADGTSLERGDPRAQDGLTFVDVERADLGVTETFQVADAPDDNAEGATKATTRKRRGGAPDSTEE